MGGDVGRSLVSSRGDKQYVRKFGDLLSFWGKLDVDNVDI
jgi:hypothetical protein